jgi:hypothetical protein
LASIAGFQKEFSPGTELIGLSDRDGHSLSVANTSNLSEPSAIAPDAGASAKKR